MIPTPMRVDLEGFPPNASAAFLALQSRRLAELKRDERRPDRTNSQSHLRQAKKRIGDSGAAKHKLSSETKKRWPRKGKPEAILRGDGGYTQQKRRS
ncbi:hypothetical protein NKJ23_33830 [Mesorhizobium sp. M0184]|uniref:hypothetical protein n=1 Tax=Mesorhizobium sp. M0184 TaxID=2956906 RepID=UPI0033370863